MSDKQNRDYTAITMFSDGEICAYVRTDGGQWVYQRILPGTEMMDEVRLCLELCSSRPAKNSEQVEMAVILMVCLSMLCLTEITVAAIMSLGCN